MLSIIFKKNKKCYHFYEITNGNIWVTKTDKNGNTFLIETLYIKATKSNVLQSAKKYGLLEKHIDPLYPNQQHFKI
jgi:hypothetical protein